MSASPPSGPPPPGWYDDPGQPGSLRWWDGTQWTEHIRPAPTAGGATTESGAGGGATTGGGVGGAGAGMTGGGAGTTGGGMTGGGVGGAGAGMTGGGAGMAGGGMTGGGAGTAGGGMTGGGVGATTGGGTGAPGGTPGTMGTSPGSPGTGSGYGVTDTGYGEPGPGLGGSADPFGPTGQGTGGTGQAYGATGETYGGTGGAYGGTGQPSGTGSQGVGGPGQTYGGGQGYGGPGQGYGGPGQGYAGPAGPTSPAPMEGYGAVPGYGQAIAPERLAGFGPRVAASLIDGLIFFAFYLILFVLSLLAGRSGLGAFFGLLILLVIYVGGPAYFIAFEGSPSGQTYGKHIMKIRVVRATGAPVGYGLAFGRYFARILSSIPFGLGYLWMLWDPEKRTWHDMLANTRVVTVPQTETLDPMAFSKAAFTPQAGQPPM